MHAVKQQSVLSTQQREKETRRRRHTLLHSFTHTRSLHSHFTHTHTYTHTHTLSLSRSHTHTLTPSLLHSHTLSLTHFTHTHRNRKNKALIQLMHTFFRGDVKSLAHLTRFAAQSYDDMIFGREQVQASACVGLMLLLHSILSLAVQLGRGKKGKENKCWVSQSKPPPNQAERQEGSLIGAEQELRLRMSWGFGGALPRLPIAKVCKLQCPHGCCWS